MTAYARAPYVDERVEKVGLWWAAMHFFSNLNEEKGMFAKFFAAVFTAGRIIWGISSGVAFADDGVGFVLDDPIWIAFLVYAPFRIIRIWYVANHPQPRRR